MGTTINMTIRRKVGSDDVEIRLASVVEKGGEDSELRRLQQIVSSSLKDYVQVIGPSMPVGGPTGAAPMTTGGQWYDVEEFVYTKDKGKAYLKACMAQWQKHGLVVWPEIWKAAGIKGWPEAEQLEGKNPGYKVYVGEKAGKFHVLEMIKKAD